MGFQNIIEGGGISLAILGMAVVFFGLLFISFYIGALPVIVSAVERWQARRTERLREASPPKTALAPGEMDPALRAAIGLVIEMELANEAALDDQRITIQHDESQHAWAFAGKMRTLSTRI